MEWRLADAKNRFSELVTRALAEGPQRVGRRDDAVVVVAERDYEKLTGKRPGFKDFLMGEGPSFEGLDIAGDDASMRDVNCESSSRYVRALRIAPPQGAS
jgi:prevent-host-death family protein